MCSEVMFTHNGFFKRKGSQRLTKDWHILIVGCCDGYDNLSSVTEGFEHTVTHHYQPIGALQSTILLIYKGVCTLIG